MKNLFTKSLTASLLAALLTACGGGGGDSKSSAPVAPAPEPVATSGNNEEEEVTADLTTTPDFTFSGSYELTVVVEKAEYTGVQYYVNVCSDYEASDPMTVKYDSCMLRTHVTEADQEFVLSLSESQESLLAQVWPMENGAEPIDIIWQKGQDTATWRISF